MPASAHFGQLAADKWKNSSKTSGRTVQFTCRIMKNNKYSIFKTLIVGGVCYAVVDNWNI